MQFAPFSISRLPRISYGSGRINEVPALAASLWPHRLAGDRQTIVLRYAALAVFHPALETRACAGCTLPFRANRHRCWSIRQ